MQAGTFLKSTSFLEGDFFEDTIILITEYNEKGAIGFVVNKLFPRKFNELEEFRHCTPLALYDGGPVDREHLFFIHQRPELIHGGVRVTENIYFGGDFKEAVRLINNKTITEKDLRLFIGYCGWEQHDLEAEIEEGSWLIEEAGKLF
ncbi:MAG: YqgE/AlgH family protein [Chitinophagaceae bacterium]